MRSPIRRRKQCLDALALPRAEPLVVGGGAQLMGEPGGEEHQLGGLVARIVGAVTEMHPRAAQRPRRNARWRRRRFQRADGFNSCVG